jgi:hypothetical protein
MVLHPINAFNCRLPEKCRIENVYSSLHFYYLNQKEFNIYEGVMCDVNEKFEFTFKNPIMTTNDEKCFTDNYFNRYNYFNYVIFRWTNDLEILEKRFNFTNLMSYLSFFKPLVHLILWGVKGFDVRFLDENHYTSENSLISVILLSDCRLNFYHNKKKINSCQDFIDLNLTQIGSIFQIKFNVKEYTKQIEFRNIEYRNDVCSLVFQNAKIGCVLLNNLVDSFYKKNVLTFSNETYPQLNSDIERVELNSY